MFLLTGCVTLGDPESAQDTSQEVVAVASGPGEEQTVKQTFVSRRTALNGLTLWLAPGEGHAKSGLTITLYRLEETGTQSQVQSPAFSGYYTVTTRGPLQIAIPPRPDPPGQKYLLLLETAPPDTVQVLGGKGDVYPEGQAFQGSQPLDADLAFRTSYRYGLQSIGEDLARYAGDAWLALPLALTLLLPGWLLLDLSGLRQRFDGGEQAALSVGLSLAVIPLVMLWTGLAGLHWSRPGVMFVMGVLAGLAIWRIFQPALAVKIRLGGSTPILERSQETTGVDTINENGGDVGTPSVVPTNENVPGFVVTTSVVPTKKANDWLPTLALAAIFLFSLAARLAMVRDLAAPAWVDSVHHGLIARLILENGGFPRTYAPYLDLDPTEYHAGYHSSLATFLWISGLDILQGMLLEGQVLNALAVVAVYLLATTLLRSRLAGLLAATITGLFTIMPAYYTSWGRYTQLAGLLILPAALALIRQALPFPRPGQASDPAASPPLAGEGSPRSRAAAMFLACIALGGLLLVHYRAAAFLVALALPDGLFQIAGQVRQQPAGWRRIALRWLGLPALLGLGALLLSLPWMGPDLAHILIPVLSAGNSAPSQPFSDFSWRFLNAGMGKYVTWLAGMGLAWGLLQRQRPAWVLALWMAGMLFLANLGSLGLPGGWLINNLSVTITLFMPVSILAGDLLGQFLSAWDQVLPARARLPYRGGLALAAIVLAGFGARSLLPTLNPTTFLFRQADRPALQWIGENLPAREAILINPFLWGYGAYAGNDGGFWISALAGRPTLPPPVLYGFGSQEEYYRVESICKQVISLGNKPEELWALLRSQNIRYVYLGRRGGPLSPADLTHSPRFRTLYHGAGTWVLEANP